MIINILVCLVHFYPLMFLLLKYNSYSYHSFKCVGSELRFKRSDVKGYIIHNKANNIHYSDVKGYIIHNKANNIHYVSMLSA